MLYIVSTVALDVEQILKKGQLNKHIVLKHNILEIGCRYRELPGVQVSFRKGRGTRDQIVNISWTMEKAREFQKNIYFCFIDYAKAFDCVDHKKMENNASVQFSSVAQSCPTLCDPMNRSTPGLPVHHQLPEFTQTHGHRVSDAIQPSHPLSSPSPAPNPSQHQSLFQ